jgi:multidrug efflux system membrane fusion protein
MKSVSLPLSVAALSLAVLGLAACGGDAPTAAPGATERVSARIARAERIELPQRLELSGGVEADRVAAVSSRVMAAVTAVPVKAGDTVAKGAVLVEIDPDTAQGQVSQARGALAQAQAALSLAERNYSRFKALVEKRAASQLELDMARMQYEQAQGAVKQAEGAVEAATSVARESTVTAPFAGRVTAKLVEVGDLAAPGRPLVMLESLQGRRLALAVPESAAAAVKVGDRLDVSIDALPELGRQAGKVVEKSPGADPATHTFTVKVQLEGPPVPSGLSGRGWVRTGTRTAVVVPASAVVQHGGVAMVVIRDPEGRARSRAVTAGGPVGDGRVEILSGLGGGEPVLVGISAIPPDGAEVVEAGR